MKILNIQSYVDLITNSSTSIFQFADNPSGVKAIFNAILKLGGSDKKFEDLFSMEVKTTADIDDAWDYYLDIANRYTEQDEELNDLILRDNEFISSVESIDYENWENLRLQIYNILISKYNADSLTDWADSYNETRYGEYVYSSNYCITPLKDNKEAEECLNQINELFSYEAHYC